MTRPIHTAVCSESEMLYSWVWPHPGNLLGHSGSHTLRISSHSAECINVLCCPGSERLAGLCCFTLHQKLKFLFQEMIWSGQAKMGSFRRQQLTERSASIAVSFLPRTGQLKTATLLPTVFLLSVMRRHSLSVLLEAFHRERFEPVSFTGVPPQLERPTKAVEEQHGRQRRGSSGEAPEGLCQE